MPTVTVFATAAPTELDAVIRDTSMDAAGLVTRQDLYGWQVPVLDLPGLVASELPRTSGTVIDVGCGNGVYLQRLLAERPALRPVGLDIAHQMLVRARTATRHPLFVTADVAALPFADASVLGAIAMHVLYLVSDPGRAVAELRRVVRPGGLIVVGTSAEDDKELVQELLANAVEGLLPASVIGMLNVHRRFDLDAAITAMRATTPEVAVHELRSEIRLVTAEPLIAYIDSLSWLCAAMLPAREWSRAIARVRASVTGLLATEGTIRIPTHIGVVVGRVPTCGRHLTHTRRRPELGRRRRRDGDQPAGWPDAEVSVLGALLRGDGLLHLRGRSPGRGAQGDAAGH